MTDRTIMILCALELYVAVAFYAVHVDLPIAPLNVHPLLGFRNKSGFECDFCEL